MKSDELKLRLVIDVTYEIGRTSEKELVEVLLDAAEHLAANGLLSGDTEADVLTWEAAVPGQ